MDQYGDHMFRCNYNKVVLHNDIRDVVYVICEALAPGTGFTHSSYSVIRETPNLIPEQPTKRPADVGFPLCPSALSSPPPLPATYLAIDVTVPRSPALEDRSDPTTNPTTKAHLHSIKKKLRGIDKANAQATQEQYIQNLLHAQLLLLPFTVDHLGGLGPFSHSFLYGSRNRPPPIPQSWIDSLPDHAKTAYNQAITAPSALLLKANKASKDSQPAHSDKPVYTPLQWAQQTLALNISLALIRHLQRALSNASHALESPNIQPLHCHYQPFNHRLPPNTVDPLPHFLMQTSQ